MRRAQRRTTLPTASTIAPIGASKSHTARYGARPDARSALARADEFAIVLCCAFCASYPHSGARSGP
ncbi:MAG: hypothetical protein JWN39_2083 [Ilumatobacteraceae bacterium]|nr:hypothetical protein [Ilumatobacteraceae bacterium]